MTVSELKEHLDVLEYYGKGNLQVVIRGLQMKISTGNIKLEVVEDANEVILKEVKR